jgi:hypothetical protein
MKTKYVQRRYSSDKELNPKHGINNNVQFADDQQTKIINLYKNTKDKLFRTNAIMVQQDV